MQFNNILCDCKSKNQIINNDDDDADADAYADTKK